MKRAGFTLVEIMIVVAIIALLAAIAIPNLLRARHNANEAAAQAALKTVSTASESFRAAQTSPTYPASLNAMTSAIPSYLDGTFDDAGGNPSRQGYTFQYTQINANQFVCSGIPASAGVTGTRRFAVNESGVLRADTTNTAQITTEAAYSAMTPVQ
ncbi:MAG: prepilin-type N-terminal cleavage/methylation domain-containing protein [Candidatus Omnitrophota bacterium]